MDKKNQQSKSQFGTLTAKSDANNDYAQGSTSATSGTTGSTFGSSQRTSGMSGTTATTGSTLGGTTSQTLTSAYDPNDQYGKKGNQNQQGTTQVGQKKPSK